MHWGGQGGHLITPRQQRLARVAAREGCNAVVGMHPHVLQGIEFMGNSVIFYSIGNFAFPSVRLDRQESLLLRLAIGRHGLATADIVPAEISSSGAPRIASARSGEVILNHLDNYCRMFNSRVQHGRVVRAERRQKLEYDLTAEAGYKARQKPLR